MKVVEQPPRMLIEVGDSVAASLLAGAYNAVLNGQARRIQWELSKAWHSYSGDRKSKRRFLRLWWRWKLIEQMRLTTDSEIAVVT